VGLASTAVRLHLRQCHAPLGTAGSWTQWVWKPASQPSQSSSTSSQPPSWQTWQTVSSYGMWPPWGSTLARYASEWGTSSSVCGDAAGRPPGAAAPAFASALATSTGGRCGSPLGMVRCVTRTRHWGQVFCPASQGVMQASWKAWRHGTKAVVPAAVAATPTGSQQMLHLSSPSPSGVSSTSSRAWSRALWRCAPPPGTVRAADTTRGGA
jgi:hypothetical protein